jgi:hypothetical protein
MNFPPNILLPSLIGSLPKLRQLTGINFSQPSQYFMTSGCIHQL